MRDTSVHSIPLNYPLKLRRVREALRNEPHGRDLSRLLAGLGGLEDDLVRRHLPLRVLIGDEGLQLRPLVHAKHLLGLDNRQLRVRRLRV